jgi:hypothetical protein
MKNIGGSWVAYGAALWALVFAVLHVVWATGWYIGLPTEWAQKAFAQPWFLAYDLVVAGIGSLAVLVALALVRPWGRRLPRWLVGLFAWGGTGLLVLGCVVSVVRILYLVVKGTFVAHPMYPGNLFFYLGAVLFGLSTWRFWRVQPRPSVAD